MNQLLTAGDPGDATTMGGTLHALSREGVMCHRCGDMGHFARDCQKPWQPQQRAGFVVPRDGRAAVPRAGLNALAHNAHVQYGEQEQYAAEISKADIEDIHRRLDALGVPALSAASISQMATTVPALPSPTPLIMGGPQPEGYVYVGLSRGLPLWEHESTVAASFLDAGVAGTFMEGGVAGNLPQTSDRT